MKNKEDIYNSSPTWFQNILISLKGFEFETKRVKKKLALEHYNFLLKSQYWSTDHITEYQNKLFLWLLKEAFLNVPYYKKLAKELSIDYRDVKSIEEIHLLPILDKDKIKGNEQLFLNQKVRKDTLLESNTSGTTGSPLKLFYNQTSFSNRWAFELRLRKWANLNNIYHPRRVQFTGRDIIPLNNNKKKYWRYNLASNTLHCSTSHIDIHTAKFYAKAISDFNPEFIDGYPSAISILVKICLENGYYLPKVKAVRVSAETLFTEDRVLIETAFSTKVFNQYGSSESSSFCSDNEYGEMLVHPEFGIFEISELKTDSSELEKYGEVITTSFMNPNMPLIRYRIGDLVKKAHNVSSVYGKNFIRLDSVLGRVDDILFIPGRGYIGRLDPIFKGVSGIYESQIILDSQKLLKINIVPDQFYSISNEEKLLEKLRKKVGVEIEIKIILCDKIERGPNGKFKAVIDNTNKNK